LLKVTLNTITLILKKPNNRIKWIN
jgi:hypothetical protein